jgi:hypothetical protein
MTNLLPLTLTIHNYFNERWPVIVPKVAGAEVGATCPPLNESHISFREASCCMGRVYDRNVA